MYEISIPIWLFITFIVLSVIAIIESAIAGWLLIDLITMLIDDFKRYGGRRK